MLPSPALARYLDLLDQLRLARTALAGQALEQAEEALDDHLDSAWSTLTPAEQDLARANSRRAWPSPNLRDRDVWSDPSGPPRSWVPYGE